MKCYQCEATAPETARFCPKCGAPLAATAELIRRAMDNDQGAIGQLYEMTYNNVYLTIRMMIKDEDQIHDLLQDTYLRAFASLSQLKEPAAFRGWVKRIAHNLAVDELRKKKPMAFSSMVSTDSDEMLDFKDERPGSMPEEVMDYQETKRLLSEIMDTLPEDQRAVISLYYYEGISVKGIAAMLRVSENTVKSRLVYGRKKIELEVKALEKKGTKLYGLAPLPFLLYLFRNMDAQCSELPDAQILKELSAPHGPSPSSPRSGESAGNIHGASETASDLSRASGVGAKAVKTGASILGKSAATKMIAGIVAVAVIGGGVGAVVVHNHNSAAPSQEQSEPIDNDRLVGNYQMLQGALQMEIVSSGEATYRVTFRDGAGNVLREASVSRTGYAAEDGSFSIVITGNVQVKVEGDPELAGDYLCYDRTY